MLSSKQLQQVAELAPLSAYARLYSARLNQQEVLVKQLDKNRPQLSLQLQQFPSALPAPLQQWSDNQADYFCYAKSDLPFHFEQLCQNLPQADLTAQLQLMLQLARLLARFHQQQLVIGALRPNAIYQKANSPELVLLDTSQVAAIKTVQGLRLHSQSDLNMLRTLAPEATGRVNAPLDQRTDLYSLGVLFYRIVAGFYPFAQQQPLELVYAHIALPPAPLTMLPTSLSGLILTLLQKNPNQRYSHINGVLHDLALMLQQWQQLKQIELPALSLRLGHQQLQFSGQLYGRELQQAQLLAWYSSVRKQAKNQLVLIEGYSGVGKSALIEQLYRQTLAERPHFCRGKFDQYQRNQLYSALQQILTELAEQLLQESEQQLRHWQQQLQQAVGHDAALLLSLVPALQPLLPDSTAPLMAAKPRADSNFDQLLLRFFRVVAAQSASEKRPLVLLLDDLQWADLSSLRLLHSLMTDDQISGVLLLLSYRDNEMDVVHPVRHLLTQLDDAGIQAQHLQLSSLDLPAVTALLADTLQQNAASMTDFASLLISKTSGNPFFVRQFLLTLQQEQLLSCDLNGHWHWDLSQIARQNITDNLVELTAQRFEKLSEAARQLLKVSALLGEKAETQLLQSVLKVSYAAIEPLIAEVVDAGIMTAYSNSAGSISMLRFVHDRLQQAAFATAAADEAELHFAIAAYYLQQSAPNQQLFAFIDHLNAASELAVSHFGADQVARLNLQAGQQAQASNAWHDASAYYQRAAALCPAGQQALLFEAELGLASCQYLTQQYEEAGMRCQLLAEQAADTLSRMQVAKLQILLLFARNDFVAAFSLAESVLLPLGIDLTQRDDIATRYLQLENLYNKEHIADLYQRPALTAPEQLLALEILNSLLSVAYIVSPQHYLAVSYALVTLAIRHGHCAAASKAYSTYAQNLCGAFDQYKEALDFADLALAVNQQYQGKFAPELNFQRAATVLPWNAPLADSLESLEQNVFVALQHSNLEYAVHSALFFSFYQVLSGTPLDEVAANLSKYHQFIADKRFAYNLQFIRLWQQFVLTLQQNDGNLLLLSGTAFDEDVEVPLLEQSQNVTILFCYHSIKLMLAFLAADDESAIRHYQAALPLVGVAMSLYHQTEFYFFAALLATRLCKQNSKLEAQWRPLAEQYLTLLHKWSIRGGANHRHKVALLMAELSAINKEATAWQAYDRAIELAENSGFTQHLAISQELAAAYWQSQDKTDFAALYQHKAQQSYQQWQAHNKVALMQQQQPQLKQQHKPQSQLLDMASVLKAAETLSGQIDLAAFLQQMIDLIVENAGAQAGHLLLLDDEQQLQPKACSPQNTTGRLLSGQLQALVCRSLQPRLINDTSTATHLLQDLVSSTAQQPLPAAILCIPVIVSGQLYGLLYLEHFELTGAFTEQRINLLQLLANQTAILFENTRLYHQVMAANKNLEQKVWERTQELASAKIRAEDATAAKSSFLARMSHEIRTPINAVIGLSRLAIKTELNSEQQDYIGKIQESGEVLLSLVNDILDFSKIEAGKLELEQTRFPLEKVVRRAVNLNALKAHAKGLELVCDIDPQIPSALLGDPLRIQQVLVNLISNAVKFSDQGAIGIKLQLVSDQGEQLKIQGSVSDNGIGISPDQQRSLFQSFSQADDSITRKYGGSGLGLAICKQLCELMQGEIWLESTPDVGSTFYFSIMLGKAPALPAANHSNLPLDFGKLRALVVDDISLARTVLLSLLSELGISADETDNGYQAIELVQQARNINRPYDFVLMDWRMPGLDGIETSRRIQQLDNAPHILMVSAYDKEQAKANLQGVKIHQFIEKPVNHSMLLDAIYNMQQHEQPAARRMVAQDSQIPNLSPYRILLVEDHPINRQVALGLLKDSKVQVDIAENGLLAIRRLQQQKYDLVLMDIQMPQMDGLTATRQIRQQLMLTDLPIIAMTAHAMQSDIAQSKVAGMNEHLTKPIDPEQLYRTLLTYLTPVTSPAQKEGDMALSPDEQLLLTQLAIVPDLDTVQAQKNLGGKTSLYLNLLRDFEQEHRSQVATLQQLYQQQQWQQLHLDIHSLKSTSAYIGAFTLSQSCQKLETMLAEGGAEAEAFELMLQQLAQLQNQLSRLMPAQAQKTGFVSLEAVLQALLPLLRESDFAAEELVPALLELGRSQQCWPQLCQITDEISDVEYERAAVHCQQLLQQLQKAQS
ncbi:response regulator [Rheinheimera sp.]|uniref:response regulator n=1 Tax=Rheinheimera sp. TaxID=1869214 RepID=UPI0027BA8B9F|nr:response regulator [Rheinheimera sp.]